MFVERVLARTARCQGSPEEALRGVAELVLDDVAKAELPFRIGVTERTAKSGVTERPRSENLRAGASQLEAESDVHVEAGDLFSIPPICSWVARSETLFLEETDLSVAAAAR